MQFEELYFQRPSPPPSVIIDRVLPDIDHGKFAVKRYLDEEIEIIAHLLVHGHELPKGRLLVRHESEEEFQSFHLWPKGNDEWAATFMPEKLGTYHCRIEAALDRFGSWKSDTLKKSAAGQNIHGDLQSGQMLLSKLVDVAQDTRQRIVISQAVGTIGAWLGRKKNPDLEGLKLLVDDPELLNSLQGIFEDKSYVVYPHEIQIQVEPLLARFSSWYEFFPRSVVKGELRHGSFKDAEERLAYIKDLGFNVVYFPPIHPIGKSFRKGKNNSLKAQPGDVGSPWAIGGAAGGHKEILPELGSVLDFEHLVAKARGMGLEIAMDIAFQCSPDHPYLKSHPEWFKKRPDGSIQYAENPPKKYQDIYPFDFECAAWQSLWEELLSIVQYWVERGVKVFRVDNPHTKPFHFWEWLIKKVRTKNPEVIFLAEAFTRPKIMAYLAKLGFSQSYTYFTWRNAKWELTQYMKELTQTELKDFYGANFWPNTPDILHEHLQEHNATVYKQRLVLAATLMSNYGIYGPAYELLENRPRENGSEEYLNSEKYELRKWELNAPHSIASFIKRVNAIRNKYKSLQQNRTFRIHPIDNEKLMAYSKSLGSERIVMVVNLDPHKMQSGLLELPLIDWNISDDENFEMEDLLTGAVYSWHGWRNFVELRPHEPAHIFRVRIQPRPSTPQGAQS